MSDHQSAITRHANHMPLTVGQAFNPRSNSIGFLRWLMAFLVIFSHAGPIGGFYHGEDLGVQISDEQSLGGVAVAGFFFFSGFLITRSRMGRSTIWRYLWRRCLRIFPAFWTALLLTVGVLAPIAWIHGGGTLHGYLHPDKESPLTYFVSNMWLHLGQRNIAGMGSQLPYAVNHGAYDWNGSAWTLEYEFRAYLIVAVLGSLAILANRKLGGLFAGGMIVLNALQWMGAGSVVSVSPLFGNIYNLMFFAPYCFGMLFALYGDRIPVDDRLAVAGILLGLGTYALGGWNIVGQYGFAYFLMWLAIRLPLTNWEKHGDLSYGIYIYAWPLMTFSAFFGLQTKGWLVYHLVIVVGVHVLAYLSWHLIEKPSMELKNWTPKPVHLVIDRCRPRYEQLLRRLIVPAFSSSRFATRMLEERGPEGDPR
ncbi:acyltransferase family protein [Schaalia naturae]|uniref:Acyltransferase family protein n=1 Tax=Schaalia naturae TaxID=635203 RepID=A0ABW2SJX1_9ACTO